MAEVTYADLGVQTTLVGGDLLAAFRSTGPLKSITGTVLLSFISSSGTFLPLAGGTMTGRVNGVASASGGSGYAPFKVTPGVNPTTNLADGDLWSTTTGGYLKFRASSVTNYVVMGPDLLTLALGGSGKTLTLAGDLTTAGAYALTLTQTGATNVTLPTTGTLATLAGVESFSNKTFTTTAVFTGATSSLDLGATGGNLGIARLFGSTSGSVTIKPAAVAGTSTIFQLPETNGTSGYVLQTDGAGVTSWVAASSGLTVGTTAITSGTSGRVLYDNAGVLGEKTVTGTGSVVLDTAPTVSALTATGTTTPTGLVDISGASAGQIKFPATQNPSANANTLDDYEEGTWTPSIYYGGSASSGQSITTTLATYVKIGKRVWLSFDFTVTAAGSGTGNANPQGFPYTPASGNWAGSLAYATGLTSVTVPPSIVLGAAAANCDIYIVLTGNPLDNTNVVTGSRFIGEVSYET